MLQAERAKDEKGGKKAKTTDKCRQYNEKGSCQWGVNCNRLHKCSKCNGDHPAHACKATATGGGSAAPGAQ